MTRSERSWMDRALALAEAESNRRRFGLQADVPEDVISARELDLVRLDLELSEREVAHREQLIGSLDRRADSEIKSLEARLARQELDVRQLEQLIEPIDVVGQIDRQIRFLRSVPVDPMTGEAEWGMRSVSDEADSSFWGGENIFDVYSLSEGVGLNGVPYSEW